MRDSGTLMDAIEDELVLEWHQELNFGGTLDWYTKDGWAMEPELELDYPHHSKNGFTEHNFSEILT